MDLMPHQSVSLMNKGIVLPLFYVVIVGQRTRNKFVGGQVPLNERKKTEKYSNISLLKIYLPKYLCYI